MVRMRMDTHEYCADVSAGREEEQSSHMLFNHCGWSPAGYKLLWALHGGDGGKMCMFCVLNHNGWFRLSYKMQILCV